MVAFKPFVGDTVCFQKIWKLLLLDIIASCSHASVKGVHEIFRVFIFFVPIEWGHMFVQHCILSLIPVLVIGLDQGVAWQVI